MGIGGVEALWNSLRLADTSRTSDRNITGVVRQSLELMCLLKDMRRQSRRLDTVVREATSAISDYLTRLGDGSMDDNEQTHYLADLVQRVQTG